MEKVREAYDEYKETLREYTASDPLRARLVAVEKLVNRFPKASSYGHEVLPGQQQQFTRLRSELNARLGTYRRTSKQNFVRATDGTTVTKTFAQSGIPGLVNANGICVALSVDWLRRKLWNVNHRGQEMNEAWAEHKRDPRMQKVDALQTKHKNFYVPHNALAQYDEVRDQRRQQQGKAPKPERSYSSVIHPG